MLKRMDRSEDLPKAAVISVWRSVVGDRIADHTYVVGVRKRELLIATDSAAWASELTYMAEELKTRINEGVGQELVGSMRFTVSRDVLSNRENQASSRETQRRYGGERVEPEPLTLQERAAIERSVESIANEGLREAALKATVRDLEWKKGKERPKTPQRPPEDS